MGQYETPESDGFQRRLCSEADSVRVPRGTKGYQAARRGAVVLENLARLRTAAEKDAGQALGDPLALLHGAFEACWETLG